MQITFLEVKLPNFDAKQPVNKALLRLPEKKRWCGFNAKK